MRWAFWKRDTQIIHLIGEPRAGGYIYLTSPELPGFTFLLGPDEKSIEAIIEAIKPALATYLPHHLRLKDRERAQKMTPRFTRADFSGPRLNLFAELQAA
ncbi:MAG: hypothetical protein IT539_03870 [Bradyrhizobiaceae bacterium]|nr:hypothetical protein [Bradyrhizobiaceae bacterium]